MTVWKLTCWFSAAVSSGPLAVTGGTVVPANGRPSFRMTGAMMGGEYGWTRWLGLGIAAVAIGGLILWQRRRKGRPADAPAPVPDLGERRYRQLFDNTPVQILEEDFAAVEDMFSRLRAGGVTDFVSHLQAHPELPRAWLERVRLVDANRPAVAAAGFASRPEMIAGFPRTASAPYLQVFEYQLGALWAGRRLFGEEIRYLDAEAHERACLMQCRVDETNGNADFSRVVVVLVDITTAQRTASAQVENQELLRQILSRADILLWWGQVRREDGNLRWKINVPSQSFDSPLFRLATARDRGGLWDGEHVPEFQEMGERAMKAIFSGSAGYQHEFRVLSSTGATHWLSEDVGISRLGADEWSLVGVVTDVTARHEAEEARRTTEAQLREILNRADCMLWRAHVRRDGDELRWNNFDMPVSALYLQIFGDQRPIQEGKLRLWSLVHAPDLPEMNRRSLEAVISGATGYEQDFRVVTPERTYWLHEQVSIAPAGRGEWNLVGVITDVTARHEAEEARKVSDAQLRQILNQADCMLWKARVVRIDGVLQWRRFEVPSSALHKRLFGADSHERDSELWSLVNVPEFAEMNERSSQAVLTGASGYEQDFRVVKPATTFWVHEQVTIVRLGEDEWAVVGVLMDVTAAHMADEARKATEERLRQLLDRADCLLWQARVTENAGGGQDWALYIPQSRLHQELFGSNSSEDPGLMWSELNVPELAEMNARSTAAIRDGRPGYEQDFHVRQEKRTYVLHEQVSITSVAPGRWNLVGVITDVTAARQAEEARRASEAQLRQILDRVDCLLWHAQVTETDGHVRWEFDVPVSGLQRRIFGGEGAMRTKDLYAGITVPEMKEMHARSASALHEGAPGYEQVFRIIQPERTYWLHERVSLTRQGPGRWLAFGVMVDISAAKEAEEAIRSSEARYRDLFEGAVEGVFQSTPAGRFVSVNPSLARIFGCATPEEFMTWTEKGAKTLYVKKGRRDEFFSELGASDSVTGFESEVSGRDGKTRWISENVRAVRDADGRLLHLQGFLSDVTERHKALAAIQESEGRYRALFENIPVAILEIDLHELGQALQRWHASGATDLTDHLAKHPEEFAALSNTVGIVAVNDTAVQLYKAESKEHFQQEISRLFTGEVFGVLRRCLEAIWQGRNDGEAEAELPDFAGGRHHTYLRWWMPRQTEWLRLERAVVTLVDLTELKRAEAALASEKERLTVTLRAMTEGVITTDIHGIVQFMNRAAEGLTQLEAAAVVGRPIADICVLRGQRSGEAFPLPLAQVIEERMLVELPPQTKLVGRDGSSCLVEGCCAPVHDAESEIIGTVLVIRDVTVRQRFEEELERASRLESIGILAGGIAHDFNNILTAIMGNITLAMLDAGQLLTVERNLQEAERATLRARDLTQQLLTFAKGGDPVRTAVLLPEIIREVSKFALHGSRVKCEFDLPPGLWPADADKGQLGQVVQNLVINAIQAMPEGGSIRIRAVNEALALETKHPLIPGDYVHISVADTGTGIKAEHLAKIFDPYFTTKQQGSGLGLTTVYSIVHKHQGHIEVESELGHGTTFHIWLPALRERTVEAVESRVEVVAPMQGRVLFMDDEESILSMAGMLLRRLGFAVELARDGAETVRKFAAAHSAGQPFDLVVMDLTVPGGMGGREAIEQLRQIDPGVRAVVSSGYSNDPVLANHRAYGFRGVVAKPYKVDDFARVLRAVLRESRPPLAGGTAGDQGKGNVS